MNHVFWKEILVEPGWQGVKEGGGGGARRWLGGGRWTGEKLLERAGGGEGPQAWRVAKGVHFPMR